MDAMDKMTWREMERKRVDDQIQIAPSKSMFGRRSSLKGCSNKMSGEKVRAKASTRLRPK